MQMHIVPSIGVQARAPCDTFQFELRSLGDETGREILHRVNQLQSVKAKFI
jgi:hypothetical protein